jgi:hypothetical protein
MYKFYGILSGGIFRVIKGFLKGVAERIIQVIAEYQAKPWNFMCL